MTELYYNNRRHASRISLWILLIVFMILATSLSGCISKTGYTGENETSTPTASNLTPTTELPNPASKFCIEQGYNLTIRTNPNGSQTGYCVFPNGSECEEWAYFRGECRE